MVGWEMRCNLSVEDIFVSGEIGYRGNLAIRVTLGGGMCGIETYAGFVLEEHG